MQNITRRRFLGAGLNTGLMGLLSGCSLNESLSVNSSDPELKEKTIRDIKDASEWVIHSAGVQGGYLNVPEPKIDGGGYIFNFEIPYYYYNGNLLIPTKERIESEMSQKAQTELADYMNKEITKDGITFKLTGENKVYVEINKENVQARADFAIDLRKGKKRARIDLSSEPVIINSDLYKMHSFAKRLTENCWETGKLPNSDELSRVARKHGLLCRIRDAKDFEENPDTKVVEIKSTRQNSLAPVSYQFAIDHYRK